MVQAKDLRLGNLIDRGDYICKVTKIEQDGLITEPLNYKGERFVVQKIKPIPLTPEILEKCGFKCIDEEYILEFENGIEIVQTGFMDLWEIRTSVLEKNEIPIEDTTLLYLHQLQNLTFALTGEELQVNL